ncbi:MAG: hypothetical protein C4297_15180 [Gemmataceae bacterium]
MRTLRSLRAVNRATLARQGLLGRQSLSPVAAAGRFGWLQAQVAASPMLGLGARLEGLRREAVLAALHTRQRVRAPFLRNTLHLVPADDHLQFWPLVQPTPSPLSSARASGPSICRQRWRPPAPCWRNGHERRASWPLRWLPGSRAPRPARWPTPSAPSCPSSRFQIPPRRGASRRSRATPWPNPGSGGLRPRRGPLGAGPSLSGGLRAGNAAGHAGLARGAGARRLWKNSYFLCQQRPLAAGAPCDLNPHFCFYFLQRDVLPFSRNQPGIFRQSHIKKSLYRLPEHDNLSAAHDILHRAGDGDSRCAFRVALPCRRRSNWSGLPPSTANNNGQNDNKNKNKNKMPITYLVHFVSSKF